VIDAAVDFLFAVSGDGPVLELGIGTGRIARPLAGRGIAVFGIEESAAMVAQLRAHSGGGEIDVTIGDFARVTVEQRFTLAYLVRNTITNLTTQAEQVACFRNVAAHLEPAS
jgi:SAM-dependent methyltransferase